jgi:hypothetical protein
MDEQQSFTRDRLDALPGRTALHERMVELTYLDAVSSPTRYGKRYFYTRAHKDKEKGIYYYREGREGPEQVLIDPNLLSDDGSVSVHGTYPSHDGRYVAYKLSRNNADASTMFVRDLETGKDLAEDVIEGARYANAAWLPDGSGFYYVGLPVDSAIPEPEMPGHAEIRFHRRGTAPSADTVVVPATNDPTMFLGVGVSFDGRWLVVYKVRGEGNEVWYRDLRKPKSELRALATGFDAAVTASRPTRASPTRTCCAWTRRTPSASAGRRSCPSARTSSRPRTSWAASWCSTTCTRRTRSSRCTGSTASSCARSSSRAWARAAGSSAARTTTRPTTTSRRSPRRRRSSAPA